MHDYLVRLEYINYCFFVIALLFLQKEHASPPPPKKKKKFLNGWSLIHAIHVNQEKIKRSPFY